MISVLILTLNEEANLRRCIESVSWSDDIVVLDSYSTDKTLEIARAAGARIYQRAFDDERSHRTYSLRELTFKYPWVYNPDADEVTPRDLSEEMLDAVRNAAEDVAAFRVRFKTMFMNRWIRFSSLYPTWVVRLFRPDKVSFERSINLVYVIDGKERQLQSHFLHYTFNKGFHSWFAKHNNYSTFEAIEALQSLRGRFDQWRDLFNFKAPAKRRKALKELSFRMPGRPLLRFLYMYFVRLGVLDGLPGLHYCLLLSIYEYMIVLKMKEMAQTRR